MGRTKEILYQALYVSQEDLLEIYAQQRFNELNNQEQEYLERYGKEH